MSFFFVQNIRKFFSEKIFQKQAWRIFFNLFEILSFVQIKEKIKARNHEFNKLFDDFFYLIDK